MRKIQIALSAVAIALASVVFLSERPVAQICPGTSATCPIVEPLQTLEGSMPTTPPKYVYTSGYRVDADGGGDVLFVQSGTTCISNGGSIVKDANTPGDCYYAQQFPQDVRKWGAYCDAVNPPMSGAIDPANSHSFEAPVAIPSTPSTHIAITGANSGGTLATTAAIGTAVTISAVSASTAIYSNTVMVTPPAGLIVGMSVSGARIPSNAVVTAIGVSTITISQPALSGGSTSLTFIGTPLTLAAAATTTVPMWVAITVSVSQNNSLVNKAGDEITLSDGTIIEVISVDSAGHILDAEIYQQSPVPYQSYQVTDTNSGIYTLSYVSNNQFWYGHDDSAAINMALAQTPGADIWLPPGQTCGVATVTSGAGILLPQGMNSLRGWGANSSGLVALASGFSYLMQRGSAGTGASGGGARDLFVEGNLLTTNVCGVQGGQNTVFENVTCRDGTSTEWLYGGPDATAQLQANLFLHIVGELNYFNFPFLSARPNDTNWMVGNHGTWATIIGSKFHSGMVGINDTSQSFWNTYTDDIVNGSLPFDPTWCAEVNQRKHITNLQCDNPSMGGVDVQSNYVDVQGVVTQWTHALSTGLCNVQIESGEDYEYVSGVQSVPTATPGTNIFPPNLVICQVGGVIGTNDVITGNPGASLTALGPSGSARLSHGQVYFSAVPPSPSTAAELCPANGPGGLIVNGLMQVVSANCIYLPSRNATGSTTVNYVYARFDAVNVSGTSNDSGLIKINHSSPAVDLATNDTVTISGVQGTVEANGTWQVTIIDSTHFDLIGSSYENTYTSGGELSYLGLNATDHTNAHVTADGAEVKYNDSSQTLVGLVYMDSSQEFNNSSTKRDVASWFNRQRKSCVTTLGLNSSVSGMTYSEVNTDLECEFVTWGGPVSTGQEEPNVFWSASGEFSNTNPGGGLVAAAVGFDGITPETGTAAMTSNSSSLFFPFAVNGSKSNLTESSKHYITLLGHAGTATTGMFYTPYTSLQAQIMQ